MERRLRVMTKDKRDRHVIVASSFLLIIFAGLALIVASIAQAAPVPGDGDRGRSRALTYNSFRRGDPASPLRRQTASSSLDIQAKNPGGRS
jgi:hypothetical protein